MTDPSPIPAGNPVVSEGPSALHRDLEFQAHIRRDAVALASLWTTREKWTPRTVEQIAFDDDRMLRSLSIDVEIPWPWLNGQGDERRESVPVPLLLSDGAAGLIGIEASDSEGRALPLRSHWETAMLTAATLRVLTDPESADMGALDELLGILLTEDADRIARSLEPPVSPSEHAALLAVSFRKRRLLLVDLPRHDFAREMIRVKWSESLIAARRRFPVGLRQGVSIEAAPIASPHSHFFVDAPSEMEIDRATYGTPDAAEASSMGFQKTHLYSPQVAGSSLSLTLRPTRRAAIRVLVPMLAVVGFSVALLTAQSISAGQTTVAALLLVAPAFSSAYLARENSASSWLGWDLGALAVGIASFAAAAALTLDAAGAVVDALLGIAAATAVGVSIVLAVPLVSLRREWTVVRGTQLAAYRAQPPEAPAEPDDSELKQAVDELLKSLDAPPPVLAEPGDGETLVEAAAKLARESSYKEVERPPTPVLTGDLTEDVLTLTGFAPAELAEYLEIPSTPLLEKRPDADLDDDDARKLAAVRAAALVLYGGLGAQGVRKWLTRGDRVPLREIAEGRTAQVQQRLDRYLDSPAG